MVRCGKRSAGVSATRSGVHSPLFQMTSGAAHRPSTKETFSMNIRNTKKLAAAIAGVVALATGSAAHAAFQYTLNSIDADGLPDFVLTVPTLISTATNFLPSDFDSIVLPVGVSVFSVDVFNPLVSPLVTFNLSTGSVGFFWTGANGFVGPGQYCAGFNDCNATDAIMTITEMTRVPEPGSLALLGIGLAGLATWRKRR